VDDDMPIESPKLSEQMLDSTTKALMLEIAGTYERIAKAYEEQERPVLLEQPRDTKEKLRVAELRPDRTRPDKKSGRGKGTETPAASVAVSPPPEFAGCWDGK
jgi:hypothetical protein